MKPIAGFVQNERVVSELAMLSRDPALAFRPDPAFRANFRNPDEIAEGDFDGIYAGARPVCTVAPKWTCMALRRSPKD
jgi:hypothetical protein